LNELRGIKGRGRTTASSKDKLSIIGNSTLSQNYYRGIGVPVSILTFLGFRDIM